MAIIDSQVHIYEANTPKRPWHSVPNWPDHVTGDEMVAAMDKVGVDEFTPLGFRPAYDGRSRQGF
jgi:predicted TIM-barrel fold metal-dependent hydrolase